MELDFEKTVELIPISVIENILITGKDFTKLIHYDDNKEYFNSSLESIIIDLNDYMKYMIEINDNLSKETFDRINYINTYYNYKNSFNYNDYIERANEYIPFDLLEEILTREEAYNEFINCIYINKPYNDIPIYSLVNAFSNLTNKNNHYIGEKEGEDINKKCQDICNFYNIVNKLETEDKPNYDLNKGLENKLSAKCNSSADKFEFARRLYLQSCEILDYDVNFMASKDDNPRKENIYNTPIKNINVKENKVVCKTWAEIYASMCNKNGIKAIICGDYHKYVVIDCDGIIIKADATNIYSNDNEDIMMPDIQRVKLGLKTAGYTPISNSKTFYEKLNDTDKKIDYEGNMYISDKQKLIEEYEKISSIPQINDDILTRLNIVHDILNKRKNIDVSKSFSAQVYFKRIMKLILTEEQLNNTKLFLIAKKGITNNFESNAIFRIATDNNFEYFTFGKNGLSKISYPILNQMINLNLIKMIDKNDINELQRGEMNELNRSNKRHVS